MQRSDPEANSEVKDTRCLRIVPKRLDLLAAHLLELVDHLLGSRAERGRVVEQVVRLLLIIIRVVVSEDPVAWRDMISYEGAKSMRGVFVCLWELFTSSPATRARQSARIRGA